MLIKYPVSICICVVYLLNNITLYSVSNLVKFHYIHIPYPDIFSNRSKKFIVSSRNAQE
jgi:hypothetical protein